MNYIISLCMFIIVWFFGSLMTTQFFIPDPNKVFTTMIRLIQNGSLLYALKVSFVRITLATSIAILLSIPLGLFVATFKWVGRFLVPITNAFRYLPVPALYPLLILWFGIDESMKISFLFVAVFVYLLPTVLFEILNIDEKIMDTSITLGMNKFQVITKTILPSILPSLCESFLTMYGIGWTYVVIAEVINSTSGIGFLISNASARGKTDIVFACLITIVIFSAIFDIVGNYIIKKCFAWKYDRREEIC